MVILTLAISILIALATHELAHFKNFGSIRASSSVTLIFIALTSAINSPVILTLQAICLGASFVGMTEPHRLSRKQVAAAATIFAFIFHFLIIYLKGIGGALGLSAFVSCSIIHYTNKYKTRA